jgi:hypothetical protein
MAAPTRRGLSRAPVSGPSRSREPRWIERSPRRAHTHRMTWRRLITFTAVVAQFLALLAFPTPVQAAPMRAATSMPCHDESTPDGSTAVKANDQLPCCAPICCVPVVSPALTVGQAPLPSLLDPTAATAGYPSPLVRATDHTRLEADQSCGPERLALPVILVELP